MGFQTYFVHFIRTDEIKSFCKFIERPRNRSKQILDSFHVHKCEISELKHIKALILTSQDSKIFHEQFQVEMPELPQFVIAPGQNFSIGYPIQGGVEVMDGQEGEGEAEDENIVYENTPIESSTSEVSNFIRNPCIRHIPSRQVTFNDKIQFHDKSGKEITGKLAPNDRNTAFTPNFLPVCKIYIQ